MTMAVVETRPEHQASLREVVTRSHAYGGRCYFPRPPREALSHRFEANAAGGAAEFVALAQGKAIGRCHIVRKGANAGFHCSVLGIGLLQNTVAREPGVDVSMDEDRCRVRTGARALSGVRNTALAIIRRTGQAIRQARENYREDRNEAIKAVTGRIV
jgi:hypothetical protein